MATSLSGSASFSSNNWYGSQSSSGQTIIRYHLSSTTINISIALSVHSTSSSIQPQLVVNAGGQSMTRTLPTHGSSSYSTTMSVSISSPTNTNSISLSVRNGNATRLDCLGGTVSVTGISFPTAGDKIDYNQLVAAGSIVGHGGPGKLIAVGNDSIEYHGRVNAYAGQGVGARLDISDLNKIKNCISSL